MLIELTITGALAYAGLKSYLNHQRKPKLVQIIQPPSKQKGWIEKTEQTLAGLLPFQNKQRQQLQVISEAPLEVSEAEQVINRDLKLSLVTLGLTTAGFLFNPLLTWISVPGLIYLQIPFLKTGYRELIREKRVGQGVLDSTITVVLLWLRYFWLTASFLTLMNLSLKLILKTQDKSRQKLVNILGDMPQFVWVLRGEVEVQIPLEKLTVGDVVVINPGEMIPIDGRVAAGAGSVNQHRLTGEAGLVEKEVGDSVLATTILLSGRLFIRVEKAGSETVAAQIGQILNQTADYKSTLQTRGEMIADKGALPTLALSAVTLPILGPVGAATILLSSFGYNMRIFAPISVLNFLQIAADHSILVKDGRALETLRAVDTIVFDKTGTLTEEQPYVAAVHACSAYNEKIILQYAASAEYRQTHPIALAILDKAARDHLDLFPVTEANYDVGYGLKVNVAGKLVCLGSKRFLQRENMTIPDSLLTRQMYCDECGHTLVYVALDRVVIGALELHPTIRPEVRQVVRELQRQGLNVYIISGDHEKPTQHLAHKLGISHYFAEVLPDDKARLVRELQEVGRTVCFVGDGINDAIALKQANVSVSLRGAASVAIDTAQVILMSQNLSHLLTLLKLAQKLDKNMTTNLWLTLIPGVVCVGGVYLVHLGVAAAQMLFYGGLGAGVANGMMPLLEHKWTGDQDTINNKLLSGIYDEKYRDKRILNNNTTSD